MKLLETKGLDGDLIIPEHSDPEWVQSVLMELEARIDQLDELVYECGYKAFEECRTLIAGLQAYYGGN